MKHTNSRKTEQPFGNLLGILIIVCFVSVIALTFVNMPDNNSFLSVNTFSQTAGLTKVKVCSATASSTESSNYQAGNAIDNNIATRWSSQYNDPQWIIFDVCSTQAITTVVFDWETASANNYILEGSNDASFATKTRLAEKTNMPGDLNHRIDSLNNLTGNFRYYRMWGNLRNGSWGYSIWEARFYKSSGVTYTLSVNAVNGSVTLNPPGGIYSPGTTVTLTPTPANCYRFVNWTGDTTSTSNPLNITMKRNRSVTANFALRTFSMTSSAGSNGSISPSGIRTVNCGANLTYTFTPNTGFSVGSVTVDGTNIGSLPSYTFTNIQANHTITVAFIPTPPPQSLMRVTAVSASASSTESSSYSPGNTIDNNISTRWSSQYNADPQWIVFDIGVTRSIVAIIIDWETASASNYILEGSNDQTFATKTRLAERTNMPGNINHRIDSIPGLTGTFRYYRMWGNNHNGIWGYSIWEVRFYMASTNLLTKYSVPRPTAFPSVNTAFTKSTMEGNSLPSIFQVNRTQINWSLENKSLYTLGMNTNNGIPGWWVDLLSHTTHNLGSANPGLTLSESGFTGLDGNYYVNMNGSNMIWVEKTGKFAIVFLP
jgi:hypothetical protein